MMVDFIRRISTAAIFICGYGVPLMAQNNLDYSIKISFESESQKVTGIFFPAGGTAPLPTAILLRGFPGGDGDQFGLGRNLSINGINTLIFNYRGTWGSEGLYLPSTSLEDVRSAIVFLKSPQTIKAYSIDTTRISIIGYSYGGGMALLGSLFDPSIKKVVSIAGGDLSVVTRLIEHSEEYRLNHRQMLDESMSDPAICRGLGGKESHVWFAEHRDEFDLVARAEELAKKDIFLIGGWKDQAIMLEDHILPLFRALRRYSVDNIKIQVYDTDHSFEGFKEQLADDIIRWLKE